MLARVNADGQLHRARRRRSRRRFTLRPGAERRRRVAHRERARRHGAHRRPASTTSSSRTSSTSSTPSGDFLVPDLRWFPDTPSTKDRIVSELLAGPSPWLGRGVLLTAFPTGTKQGDPVVIDAGQATVDLSSEVRSQSGPAKQRMLQQLTASLSDARRRSERAHHGRRPPASRPRGRDAAGARAHRRHRIRSSWPTGSFGFLNGTTVSPPFRTSAARSKRWRRSPSPSGRDRDAAAVLSATGRRVRARATARIRSRSTSARASSRPALDVEGYLWSITADGSGGLLAFDADNVVASDPDRPPVGRAGRLARPLAGRLPAAARAADPRRVRSWSRGGSCGTARWRPCDSATSPSSIAGRRCADPRRHLGRRRDRRRALPGGRDHGRRPLPARRHGARRADR